MASICIFEDNTWQSLVPITELRPVFTIPVGRGSFLDRVCDVFEGLDVSVAVDPARAAYVTQCVGGCRVNAPLKTQPMVLLNGSAVFESSLTDAILTALDLNKDVLLTSEGTVVAVVLATTAHVELALTAVMDSATVIDRLRPLMMAMDASSCRFIRQPWDLVSLAEAIIKNDAASFPMGVIRANVHPYVSFLNEDHIFVGANTEIEDFVVIDARLGPVIIAEDVVIESHTRIVGPTYIGPHTQILGGKIRGSSIGSRCKVSGEVSSCVFAGYTNKAHDGFFGNSYIGQWSNIGAGSITSNLKNTYGTITVSYRGKSRVTKLQFLGSILGDHVKLGIGTCLSTGSVVGTGATLFGTAIHDKDIPMFTWGEKGQYSMVDFDRFLITAERVRRRRNQQVSAEEQSQLKRLYESRGSDG